MLKNIPWNFSPRTVTLLAGKRVASIVTCG